LKIWGRNTTAIKFMLVVFNKSVELLHSKKVFPHKVTVKTANALSYKSQRQHYGLNHRAAKIMETLAMFCNSEGVGMEHTPDKWITDRKNNKEAKPLDFSKRKFLVEDAAKLHERVPAVPS
jgi:hypothetical protein